MPDLGIAHLPLGQTHEGIARLHMGVRCGPNEAVPIRGLGESDAVVGAVGALAPTIENAQDDGAGTGRIRHDELILRE